MASSQGNALTGGSCAEVFECSNPRVSGTPIGADLAGRRDPRPSRPAIARPPANAA